MKHPDIATTRSLIERAIEKMAGRWKLVRPDTYRFTLVNGLELPLELDRRKEFLVISADIPQSVPDDITGLIDWNARLDGGARFALAADGRLTLRADVSLRDIDGLQGSIAAACRGLATGAKLASTDRSQELEKSRSREVETPHPSTRNPQPTTLNSHPSTPQDLVALCIDAGWTGCRMSGDRAWVELNVRGAHVEARVSAGNQGTTLAADLTLSVVDCPVARLAVSVFLLTTASICRMSRPAAERERFIPRIETCLPSFSTPQLVDEGLEALSSACQLAASEVPLLTNQRVATLYLKARGIDPLTVARPYGAKEIAQ